jgi:transcriptional antiterminator Rof (Rho-off)
MVALMMAVGIALPARAADVTALPLPEYFTVRPEGEVRLVTLAADKTVAALAESTDDQSRTLAVRWDANGNRTTFRPLPVRTAPDRGESDTTKMVAGVVAAPGVVYVNVSGKRQRKLEWRLQWPVVRSTALDRQRIAPVRSYGLRFWRQ